MVRATIKDVAGKAPAVSPMERIGIGIYLRDNTP